MLLQWFVSTVKYDSYKDEYKHVCQVLQKMAKGNESKIERFTDVAYENLANLGKDGFSVLMKAMLM